MTPTFFEKSFKKKAKVIAFAAAHCEYKLPITDCSNDHLNFVYDDVTKFKYFLSKHHWDLLYNNMLSEHLLQKGEDFNLLHNQERARLTGLKTILLSLFEEIVSEGSQEPTPGRPVKIGELVNTLNCIVNNKNIYAYNEVLFNKMEDIVTNALLKNKLTSNFEVELPETSLNNSLGSAIFNAYFYSLKDYLLIIRAKNEEQINTFEEFFLLIFDLYNNNPSNITFDQYEIISTELAEKFDLQITDRILLDVVCKKTIIYVINKLLKDPESLIFMGISNYFRNQGINENKLDVIENILNSSLTINNVLMGAIFVNKLIENDVMVVYQKPKYRKNPLSENKPETNPSVGETTLTVRFKKDLVYDVTLNGSDFRPLLQETGNDNIVTDFNVYKDDFIINFKLDNLNDKIHINKTGKGIFNRESLFAKDKNIANIFLSIDNVCLTEYLDLIQKVSGKNVTHFCDDQIKNDCLLFLSLYGVNFEQLLNTIPPDYKHYLADIIEFCLDIAETFDTTKIVLLSNNIAEIKNTSINSQLKNILRKVRAYKLVLILAIKEYILYSCFNYCIMTSYFDFRGRRYFQGLAFNIQSYPFLKAFVKIYEKDIKLMTQQEFSELRQHTISIIKDDTLKKKVSEKMESFTTYKKNLTLKSLEFLYAHIDTNKMDFISFKNLVQETSTDFKPLYQKILSVIKKSTKALIITSYILLEKRKTNTIINYTNNYSYDMVTSGYQQTSLMIPSKDMGVISNLIGDQPFDLYLDISQDNKEHFIDCVEFYKMRILTSPEISIFIHTHFSKMHTFGENNNIIRLMLKNSLFLTLLLNYKEEILSRKWVLFPSDIKYLAELNSTSITENLSCILILWRISLLKQILDNNAWLLEKNVLGSRNFLKHIIMIELYGGTRRGRERAYNDFINEICMDTGLFFKTEKDMSLLFYFVENHYKVYKIKKLSGAQKIIKLGKVLASLNQTITIKNPHFICKLAPTKFINAKRIKINSYRIKVNRVPYQLTINRPQFSEDGKLTDSALILNKQKLATLFPPDFVHSMDAMLPQIAVLKIHRLNELINNRRFSLISTHDNVSSGYILFEILPEILIDIYREIYDYNYLTSLKDNFNEQEFQLFLSLMKPSNPFSKEDINNLNMMKYG